MLAGRPLLRTPGGDRELAPGAVVASPLGAEGAHALTNDRDEPARFIIASTMRVPEIAEYPDTGATPAMTAAGEGRAFPSGTERPYAELVAEATAAAP